MDKRELSDLFRARLMTLIERAGGGPARFAEQSGLDRSALSQFLSPGGTRLPRAETLRAIAQNGGVSADWLLGLSNSEGAALEALPSVVVEGNRISENDALLDQWRREALGYKIRYAPLSIPDLLRLPAATAHEFNAQTGSLEARGAESRELLAYSRRPETDMECCMPLQTLEALMRGEGPWRGLDPQIRRRQILRMAMLCEELYPTFRLFLYDGRGAYSSPFTIYGPQRAALYLGGVYLVLNTARHIQALTRRFDDLIRIARIGPDRAAEHLTAIAAQMPDSSGDRTP